MGIAQENVYEAVSSWGSTFLGGSVQIAPGFVQVSSKDEEEIREHMRLCKGVYIGRRDSFIVVRPSVWAGLVESRGELGTNYFATEKAHVGTHDESPSRVMLPGAIDLPPLGGGRYNHGAS